MKLTTFYKIYFRHRFEKAKTFLKMYLLFSLIIRYLMNLLYFEKKIDLDKLSQKNSFLENKNLHQLFEFFNSDKGFYFIDQYPEPFKRRNNNNKIKAHGYSPFYENYFKDIKNQKINILELGSFYGNASAALYFYFKNAKIFGADINPDMFKYYSNRVENIYVDSGSRESIIRNVYNKKISFKIIIEDASHMLKDQILSLFILFKAVDPGGIFIIEEIDFPEKRVDMRKNQNPPDLKQILYKIKANENFNSEYINSGEKEYFLNHFESINFYKGNFNEVAIITKKSKDSKIFGQN